MRNLSAWTANNQWIFFIIILVLLIPALFINLGMKPLTQDEATRALVAQEMIISGNYIVPTTIGEYYYNKPPLYNWIIIAFFKMFNSYDELVFRLPAVLSLLGFAVTIFFVMRKQFSTIFGLVNAVALITCGRILFWDSYLGLIDICYSWVTYSCFMLVYYLHKKQKYYLLFLITYLLTAVGFLMKGLPSVVFQGITLLVFFIYMKEFKKLFSFAHLTGICLFLLITGGYYYLYYQYNPDLKTVFTTLLFQSTQRTAVESEIWETIKHLLLFPFETIYHFIPWTLLLVFVFHFKQFKESLKHPFIKFILIIFLSNIPVYWISPNIFPRYLLMLLPLLFTVLLYLFLENRKKNNILKKIIEIIFGVFIVLAILFTIYLPFINELQNRSFLIMKIIVLIALLIIFLFGYIKLKDYRLLVFGMVLLSIRIGFNWFLVPERHETNHYRPVREMAVNAGKITKNSPLFLYRNTVMNDFTTFYINKVRNDRLIRKDKNFSADEYYIMGKRYLNAEKHQIVYPFKIGWKNTSVYLVKFKRE